MLAEFQLMDDDVGVGGIPVVFVKPRRRIRWLSLVLLEIPVGFEKADQMTDVDVGRFPVSSEWKALDQMAGKFNSILMVMVMKRKMRCKEEDEM
jgi:hypothetical protein